jgi:hypothetical protein
MWIDGSEVRNDGHDMSLTMMMMMMKMTGDAGLMYRGLRGLRAERQKSRDDELERVAHEAHHQTQSKSKNKTMIATCKRRIKGQRTLPPPRPTYRV